MNGNAKERYRRHLAGVLLQALDAGLSVEDILDSLCGAVAERLRVSSGERDRRYRQELKMFYDETLLVLAGARRQVEKAGDIAKSIAGR